MTKPKEMGPGYYEKLESGSPFSPGEGRVVIGEMLRDKTVPWQVQCRFIQVVTNTIPCGPHWQWSLTSDGSPWKQLLHPVSGSEGSWRISKRRVRTDWPWNTGPHLKCVLYPPSDLYMYQGKQSLRCSDNFLFWHYCLFVPEQNPVDQLIHGRQFCDSLNCVCLRVDFGKSVNPNF